MTKSTVHIPYVSKHVEALLLWRNPKESGIAFGGTTLAFLAYVLNPFPASSIFFNAIAITALSTFIWAQMGNFVSRSGPPVPALLVCGVSENDARKLFDAALPVVNNALATLGVLASGKDMKLSLIVVAASYTAARVFAVVSPVVLIYLVVLLAFSLPWMYEVKKDEIDKLLVAAKSKMDELSAKFSEVVSKIPKVTPKKVQ